MSERKEHGSNNLIFGLLGILFIGLKLTGHITWSWWLVTLPLWGGFALMVVILLVYFLLAYFLK